MPALAATTVTQFTYDAGNHVTSVTDPRQLVTSYSYDGLGRLWQQVSPDTGTTTYNYDGYGRRSSMTRADNTQTTYGYDGLNRITSISAGGLTQTFTYDTCTHGVGRLCSAADATGTTSYSYSPEGWLTGRGFSIGGTTYSLGYSYNALGQVAGVVYPDGNQAIYSYTQGVVSGITLNIGGTNVTGASAITYRPMNAGMSSWTSSNGVVNTLSYDTDGRLAGVSAGSVQSLGFSYDNANRVTGITNGIDGSMSQNFGYDDESRLLSVYSGADIESFQYDLNGNRTSQVVNGTSTPETVSATSNQLSNFGAQSYGYDAKGNITTVAGVATYHYDAFNRMDSAGGMAYYVNPEGQRLRKSGTAGTSYFAPDRDGAMLAEYSNGGWIDYVWLNGRLIGRVAGGQRYAIHDDQTGRPEAVTDGNGTVVWRAQNFAFTQNVTNAGITLNLGFPGQYYDAETGLWNNGYRDYKSALGRYVESDPAGLNGGVNSYIYVSNNPVSLTDADGLCPSQKCLDALAEAGQDTTALSSAAANWGTIEAAAGGYNIDPAMIAAIGVRESGFRDIAQIGGGQGAGVFQIDLGENSSISASRAYNVAFSAEFAGAMLSRNMMSIESRHPNFTHGQLLQATAASYNFGVGNISGNPSTIDTGTTGNNYGSNVINLMSCFPF
jgi:RHS repeat-associated protein